MGNFTWSHRDVDCCRWAGSFVQALAWEIALGSGCRKTQTHTHTKKALNEFVAQLNPARVSFYRFRGLLREVSASNVLSPRFCRGPCEGYFWGISALISEASPARGTASSRGLDLGSSLQGCEASEARQRDAPCLHSYQSHGPAGLRDCGKTLHPADSPSAAAPNPDIQYNRTELLSTCHCDCQILDGISAKSRWVHVEAQADLKSPMLNCPTLPRRISYAAAPTDTHTHTHHAMHTNARPRLVSTTSPNAAPSPLHLQYSGHPLRAARTSCIRSDNACFLCDGNHPVPQVDVPSRHLSFSLQL